VVAVPSRSRGWTAICEACTLAWSLPLLAVTTFLSALTGELVPRILLSLVLVDIPFHLERGFLFREDAAEFGQLPEFYLSLTTVALVLLYVRRAILAVAAPAREPVRSAARISRPLGLYVGFAILSTMTAVDVSLSLRELLLLVQTFLVYVYIVRWVRARDEIRLMMGTLLICLALESLVMFYTHHVGETLSLPILWQIRVDADARAVGNVRVGGTVGSPVAAATFLSLLIAPALAVLVTNLRYSFRLLAAGSAALGAAALVLTQSRGGWLAVLLSIAILGLKVVRHRGRWIAAAVVIPLLTSVVLFSSNIITTRLTGDDQGSAQSRFPLMKTALAVIQDHPLLGVGPNNYTLAMRRYGAVYGKWGDWVYTVHNKFLLVWAETGLGGLIAFIWFMASTIRLGWKGWKAADPLLSPLAFGFTAALIGHVVHMQLDLFSGRPQVQMLWVVAALVAVIDAGTRDPDRSSKKLGLSEVRSQKSEV